MSMAAQADARPITRTMTIRWGILACGILCMVMIANLQYGWNLFVDPMSKAQGWSRAAIGGAFSVFVLAET